MPSDTDRERLLRHEYTQSRFIRWQHFGPVNDGWAEAKLNEVLTRNEKMRSGAASLETLPIPTVIVDGIVFPAQLLQEVAQKLEPQTAVK